MSTKGPAHLNTSVPHLWQEGFVCPNRPLFEDHHGMHHPQFVTPESGILGRTVALGDKVALRPRIRRVGQNLVTKPLGPVRTIIAYRDYRFNGDFDSSAFQIPVGEKAHCSPYPAKRTTVFARVAEGVFSLNELQPINS